MWPGVVTVQMNIIESKSEEVIDGGVKDYGWERPGRSGKLYPGLVEVVEIQMGIAKRMDKFPWPQPTGLCDHHGEQGIRRNIKWNTEEYIGRALVKLAG
jgi:hypothetical protein